MIPGIRSRDRQLTLKVLVAFTATIVVLVNGGGWYLYHAAVAAFDRSLEDQLVSVGELAALEAGAAGFPETMVAAGEDWRSAVTEGLDTEFIGSATAAGLLDLLDYMESWIVEAASRTGVSRLVLLDREGRALVDSLGLLDPGETESFVHVDRPEFDRSLRGIPAATLAYPVEGVYYKRAYIPVRGLGGEKDRPVLVFSVEAGSSRFAALRGFRRHLFGLGAVSLAGGFVLILFVYRVLKKNLALERAAERSFRAFEMGQMTATVAHEMRNPLAVLRTTAECLRDAENTGEVREISDDLVEEIDRLAAVVQRFSILSGAREARPAGDGSRSVPVWQFLSEFADRYRSALAAGRDAFKIELPESPFRDVLVSLSPGDLESVLRNLLDNAVESLKGKGCVTLAAGAEGTKVWMEVRDQGIGMKREEVEDSLRPFYTTKPDGTGIGLPLAQKLVELAGGTLTITSSHGRGTRVRIELPGRLAGSGAGE